MIDLLSRRDFLAYGGATLAGITLGQLGRRQLARADERAGAWRDRGLETWATSVCRECPAACGIRVRLIDGVPVKLQGNPLCPIARGRLCAKGQAAIESYFDPDRLVGPARRIGKRGENRWQPITWRAVTELLASHIGQVQARPGDGILAVSAVEHGPLADAWTRFWRAAGARAAGPPAATAARLGPRLEAMTGAACDPLFDLEHASHVLSFDAPIVEDWLSPVWAQRSYGRFRRGPARPRGRLVQVDSRRSATARKADEWLAVPAEQQVSLAYGIASVLLRENQVNRAFLDEFGGNLAAFEREVVAKYTPDNVAAATGVPVVTVLRLARELTASTQPLVVVGAHANPALVDAALALDALIGAFDRPGGVFASPAAASEELSDATAALNEIATGRLRPRLVAFRDASALRALAAPVNLDSALAGAEFIVSFSPYLDEAASAADLLLPAHTALESWHALRPAPADASDTLALARPAAPARLQTRDAAAILKTTAEAIGGSVAAACSWSTSEDLVNDELDRLWHIRRGGPYTDSYETEWVRRLEKGGWWVAAASSRDEFAAVILRTGGWIDPFFEPGRIRESLGARGGLTFALPLPAIATPASERGRVLSIAPGEAGVAPPASGSSDRFPLRLVPFTPAVVNLAGNPNQPVLFELLGQPDSVPWRVWAELNPETARTYGIEHGASIRITTVTGWVDAVAMRVEGTPRDTVALAFVPTVAESGRWARLIQADARRLWSGETFSGTCAVRVSRT